MDDRPVNYRAEDALGPPSERTGTDGADLAEYTDSDSTENHLRAWPAGDERGKAPKKSISSAAGAGARTACIGNYSGDCADACRRPHRLSDTATAGTAEYLPTRVTTDNDRPAIADRQQDTGSVRHTLADAATNRFDTYSAELYNCSKNESLQNDDTTHSDIHRKIVFNMTDGRTETGQKLNRQMEEKTTNKQSITIDRNETETRQTEK